MLKAMADLNEGTVFLRCCCNTPFINELGLAALLLCAEAGAEYIRGIAIVSEFGVMLGSGWYTFGS